jgi:hypothetical protein
VVNLVSEMITGTVLCMLHTEQAPSDGEWDAAMTLLEKHRKPDGELVSMLVFTAGGAPTVAQRRRGNQITMGRNCIRAICTDSKATLVIVRGLSWFAPGLKSFSTKELGEAVRYVGVNADDVAQVWPKIAALNAGLSAALPWITAAPPR